MSFDLVHALEVAHRCPQTLWMEGLLHDALEDSYLGWRDLVAYGIPEHVVRIVVTLTRGGNETYEHYIERVAAQPLARCVKVADLEANLARMDEAHESLRPRYERALKRLREA